MRDEELYNLGKKVRREVLGAAYDDGIVTGENEFSQPIRDLTTRYVWGEIWGDDALPRKVRSLINIGMLTALRASREIKVHIRGALNNGCTREEIRATLLQAAVYCGVPAVREAVRMANEVFAEEAKPRNP